MQERRAHRTVVSGGCRSVTEELRHARRTLVMGPNILRFAAFDTGNYCENTLHAPQFAGARPLHVTLQSIARSLGGAPQQTLPRRLKCQIGLRFQKFLLLRCRLSATPGGCKSSRSAEPIDRSAKVHGGN